MEEVKIDMATLGTFTLVGRDLYIFTTFVDRDL